MKYLKFWRFLYTFLFIAFLTFFQTVCHKDSPFQPEPEPEEHWVADTTLIPQILSQIDSSRLRNSIQTLQDFGTRYAYSPKCFEAAEWIKSELESYGYEVEYQTYFSNRFNDVCFVDENNGWLVGKGGLVLRTGDGGYTWELKQLDLISDFYEVYFVDERNGWIWEREYAGGLTYNTRDGGETWQLNQQLSSKYVIVIYFQNKEKGWACIGRGIYSTQDGGESWALHTIMKQDLYEIYFVTDSLGWTSDFDYLYQTEDGGKTWQIVNGVGHIDKIRFFDKDFGIMMKGKGKLRITTDGGRSWLTKNLGGDLYDFDFITRQKIIAVGDGYFLSEDGGLTWDHFRAGGFTDVAFRNESEGIILGGSSRIARTIDNGYSWESVRKGFPIEIYWHNVKALKPGKVHQDRKYIIGAHYDATSEDDDYPATGANDNGSGTAGVLEIANVFKDFNFDYSVEFILFSAEELGTIGSKYAASASKQNDENIIGMFNLDMIGYCPDGVYDIEIHSANVDFTSEFLQCAYPYSNIIYYETTKLYSDENSYYRQGYQAIGIYEHTLGRYPWYHSHWDTIDKLNMSFSAEVVRFTVGGLARLLTPVVLSNSTNKFVN